MEREKIIILGDGEFAEIAYEYFTYDSNYQVVAFVVEKDYITKKQLFNLPIIEFEEIEKKYPPSQYKAFTAITFTKLNRVRTRIYNEGKRKGYSFVSYVSSKAFIWHNVSIGENTFIFENNTLQYNVKIGNNVVLWSGNHIGHRATIGDNCFLASHVVVSGYCEIGESSFIGVNTTIADNIKIGNSCFVGAGSLIVKNSNDCEFLKGSPAKPDKRTSLEYFKIVE